MTRSREIAEGTEPRVYIASLRDYNEGSMLGIWLELGDYDDAKELLGAIYSQLKIYDDLYPDPVSGPREEWACHDFEGFPERFYSEGMSFEPVYEYLKLIEHMNQERIEALEIFINNGHEPEYFDSLYLGYHGGDHAYDDDKTAEAYVEEMFWESHSKDEIPASIWNYIDFASMARDQVLSGDIWVNSGHCFRS